MEPLNLPLHRLRNNMPPPKPSATPYKLKPGMPESLLWLLNWPLDSRIRCPACMGRIVRQWLLWDRPPVDRADAEYRAEIEPLCALCQSTGLVCPRCRGARWVRHAEMAAGSEHAIIPCPDCTLVNANKPHYDATTEQQSITWWLSQPAHRATHPVIANPQRLLCGDSAARQAQRERYAHQMALRGEQARANYADYVRRHGDPRASLRQQIVVTSQRRTQQISAQVHVLEVVRDGGAEQERES